MNVEFVGRTLLVLSMLNVNVTRADNTTVAVSRAGGAVAGASITSGCNSSGGVCDADDNTCISDGSRVDRTVDGLDTRTGRGRDQLSSLGDHLCTRGRRRRIGAIPSDGSTPTVTTTHTSQITLSNDSKCYTHCMHGTLRSTNCRFAPGPSTCRCTAHNALSGTNFDGVDGSVPARMNSIVICSHSSGHPRNRVRVFSNRG